MRSELSLQDHSGRSSLRPWRHLCGAFRLGVLVALIAVQPATRASAQVNQTDRIPPSPVAAVTKNIVTDFRATCNGRGDDNAAFAAFNNWALTWQKSNAGLIELDIPHGATCMFNRRGMGSTFTRGIKQLRVVGLGYAGQGDGATFSDNNGKGNGWFLGAFRGVWQDNHHSARLASVSAGARCVSLLTPAQATLFKVGNYVLISGIDMMGYGFPPNPFFYEYQQIAEIDTANNCDHTAGASITFAAPLKNTYKATWPLYNAGNAFAPDHGGPATLYALDPAWDTTQEFRGITFSADAGQTYAIGRDITFANVKFTGFACAIPTQNLSWTVVDSDFSTCAMEVDKIIGTVTLANVRIYRILFQSSSVDVFNLIDSTVTGTINGTPKKFVGMRSTIANLSPGAYAYGRTDEVDCTDCVISAITPLGIDDVGGLNNIGANHLYSMSDGTITSANKNGPPQWYVPGTHLYWAGQLPMSGPHCQVIDVTQDSAYTHVQTSCSGGFPAIPLGANGLLGIVVHPAPRFTCTNCTGSAIANMLSSAPPGSPLGSYFSTVLTSANPTVPAWLFGILRTASFNVITPYHGTEPLKVDLDDPFVLPGQGARPILWSPMISPAITGLRTVTTATVSGAQPSDRLTPPGPIWLIDNQITARFDKPVHDASVSVSITITTDQGIQ
jgi:hypothetical protein